MVVIVFSKKEIDFITPQRISQILQKKFKNQYYSRRNWGISPVYIFPPSLRNYFYLCKRYQIDPLFLSIYIPFFEMCEKEGFSFAYNFYFKQIKSSRFKKFLYCNFLAYKKIVSVFEPLELQDFKVTKYVKQKYAEKNPSFSEKIKQIPEIDTSLIYCILGIC